jgi:hypothetical protein
LTNGFSEKWENLKAADVLRFAHYSKSGCINLDKLLAEVEEFQRLGQRVR